MSSLEYATLDRNAGKVLLIDLWEDLDGLIHFSEGRQRAVGLRQVPDWVAHIVTPLGSETPQQALKRWAYVFAEELAVIRAARNSVAHGLEISDQDLVNAVQAAARLLAMAHVSASRPVNGGVQFQDQRVRDGLAFGSAA